MAQSHRSRGRGSRGARAIAAVIAAASSFAAITAVPRSAEAGDGFDDDAVIAVVVAGIVAADILFYSYDIAMVIKEQHPSVGWSIAQTIVTAPQTVAFSGMAVSAEVSNKSEAVPIFVGAMFMGSMTTHGIWSLASDQVSASQLMFISPVIAANTILTLSALARGFSGELASVPMAVTELVVGGPPLVYLGYRSAMSDDPAGWIGLTAWSGAIVLHGGVSLLGWSVGRMGSGDGSARLPRLPFTIRGFGPSMVSDGVASAPGFRVTGTF
jgi:hypothetical protein